MRNIRVIGEERETIKYWFPGTIVFAAVMLMVLVILLVSFTFFTPGRWNEGGSENAEGNPRTSLENSAGTVASQEDALNKKAAELEMLEKELKQREDALNELDSIKAEIFQELKEKLAARNVAVEIDEARCSVRFSEIGLFNVNQSEINAAGKEYLNQFLPEYFSVLLSDKNLKYIDRITIEGHADEDGTYNYNLKLSQDRAATVVGIILSQNYMKAADGTDVKELLAIAGRSSSEPYLVNGVVDRNKSRRVEFIFSLKSGV